jgi:hypothetical protein
VEQRQTLCEKQGLGSHRLVRDALPWGLQMSRLLCSCNPLLCIQVIIS